MEWRFGSNNLQWENLNRWGFTHLTKNTYCFKKKFLALQLDYVFHFLRLKAVLEVKQNSKFQKPNSEKQILAWLLLVANMILITSRLINYAPQFSISAADHSSGKNLRC